MTSVYTTAFNIVKGQFNVESAFKNFSAVGDEIVVATLKNEDNTLEVLKSLQDEYPLKIVETDYTTKTFAVDGKLKEAALQACSNDFCIQLDADERVGNVEEWYEFTSQNEQIELALGGADALMLPVVNLYRDVNLYKDIGFKWYLHRRNGLHRGVVNFARFSDGRFDTSKSDGCELIYEDGSLVKSLKTPAFDYIESYADKKVPFVVHFGHMDLIRRIELNKNFWKDTWQSYDGKTPDVLLDIADSRSDLFYTMLDFSKLI